MPGDVQTDDRIPRRLRSNGQEKDVFALVKMHMSDSVLSQAPLNVWPQALLPVAEDFWNRVNSTTHIVQQHLDQDREDELRKLGAAIQRDFPHMQRAVTYYRTLVNSSRCRKPYPWLNYIAAGPNAAERIANVQLGGRAPPPKPHPLQVVFHHQRQ